MPEKETQPVWWVRFPFVIRKYLELRLPECLELLPLATTATSIFPPHFAAKLRLG
jgi:hypothetical protein